MSSAFVYFPVFSPFVLLFNSCFLLFFNKLKSVIAFIMHYLKFFIVHKQFHHRIHNYVFYFGIKENKSFKFQEIKYEIGIYLNNTLKQAKYSHIYKHNSIEFIIMLFYFIVVASWFRYCCCSILRHQNCNFEWIGWEIWLWWEW